MSLFDTKMICEHCSKRLTGTNDILDVVLPVRPHTHRVIRICA